MTRAGKSYRSSTPKEAKEPKHEKRKRLENYRKAKVQAKKYVIPGMIAVLVSVFLLFGAMYGFKGTKIERRIDRVRDAIFKQGLADALNKEGMTQQIVDAMNKAHDVFGQPMEEVETGPSGQNEFPAAAAEAETSKIEELEAQA